VRAVLALLTASLVVGLAPAAPAPAASTPEVLDLGDSLSVGTAPHLRARLAGFRIARVHDVGLHAYDAAELVARRRGSLPHVLVVSAGTNDDPRIVSTFWRSAARIVAVAGPDRCVVWPTIVRPPAVGATYDGLNRALRSVSARHRNLVLVDWVGMVRRHPGWLSRDGVHVSSAGYDARAAAIARSVRTRCTS
jgi:lysophospholipase L1-like esterase